MMKLFGHDTSPYTRRIRVLLHELGIDFERDTHGWRVASEEAMALSPLMRVPVLLDPSGTTGVRQPIFDSRLMAEYLYARAGNRPSRHASDDEPPLQKTLWRPDHRYDDENVLLVIDGATDSLINVFLLEHDGVAAESSDYLKRQLVRAERSLTWLATRYEGRTSLGDGSLSFTDIALVCALDWVVFRERYDVSRHPSLGRVLDRHRERRSLVRTHPSVTSAVQP
jgi:glutathione S-transferase